MIKVMIVDDHVVARMGARTFLQSDDIDIVAEADAGLSAVKLVDQVKPEVVLLDFNLPDLSGFELIKRLKRGQSKPKLLMMTAIDNLTMLNRMLKAGASGILTKSCKYSSYPQAVRCAADGDIYVAPDIAMKLMKFHRQKSLTDKLNNREYEVATLVIKRMSVTRIAQQLNISPKSVSNLKSIILKKTGFQSFSALGRALGKTLEKSH